MPSYGTINLDQQTENTPLKQKGVSGVKTVKFDGVDVKLDFTNWNKTTGNVPFEYETAPTVGSKATLRDVTISWNENPATQSAKPDNWGKGPSKGGSGSSDDDDEDDGKKDSSSSGSGETSGTKAAAPDTSGVLADFLVKHIEIAFKNIPDNVKTQRKYTNTEALKKQILNGPEQFGPAQAAGVASFATACAPIPAAGATALLYDEKIAEINAKLEEMKKAWKDAPKSPNLGVWTGYELNKLNFGPDKPGLVKFLRFAYVLSHPIKDNEKYLEDATKNPMGIDPNDAKLGDAVMFSMLCILGAVSPFSFMLFKGPDAAGSLKKGTRITFMPGSAAGGAAKKGQKAPDSMTFTVEPDAEKADGGYWMQLCSAADDESSADFNVEQSKKILGFLGKKTTFTTAIGGKNYTSDQDLNFGLVVKFSDTPAGTAPSTSSAPGAGAAPSGAGAAAGGIQSRTVDLRGLAATEGGLRSFTFENKYVGLNGQIGIRQVEARLRKRVSLARDNYDLEVVNSPYMLVPVSISGAETLAEAAHWSVSVIKGSSPSAQRAACLVVNSISWSFDKHYFRVGGSTESTGGAGAPVVIVEFDEVDAVPTEPVRVVKRNQIGDDAALAAVRSYLALNANPVGEALILNQTLNRPLNSYKMSEARTG